MSHDKIKIEQLAKEIVNEIDIPQFEPLLVFRNNGRNIVLEGNRRLTVYKLLKNPQLTNRPATQKYFEGLHAKVDIDDSYILTANVTTDKNEAFRYIDRKHNKDNNEVSWTGTERDHFAVRRNKGDNRAIFKVEMTKKIKALDLDDKVKFDVLGKGYETTLWRIIENPQSRAKLRYEITEEGKLKIGDLDHFNNLLKTIVYNVWNKQDFESKDVDSRSLNKSSQVVDYLEKLSVSQAKLVDKDIQEKKNQNENLFGEKKLLKQSERKISIYGDKQKIFKSLIQPKLLAPKVSSIKIKEVFKELQIIEVDSCPTAVFALVRILTDITIKQYLELKGYKFNEFGHLIITNGKEKNKVELKEKMNYIATNYLSGDLKASVVALNEDLLTQNLNQVMHNVVFCANTKQIRDFWKNLFPFVEFLWTEIIKLESNKK